MSLRRTTVATVFDDHQALLTQHLSAVQPVHQKVPRLQVIWWVGQHQVVPSANLTECLLHSRPVNAAAPFYPQIAERFAYGPTATGVHLYKVDPRGPSAQSLDPESADTRIKIKNSSPLHSFGA